MATVQSLIPKITNQMLREEVIPTLVDEAQEIKNAQKIAIEREIERFNIRINNAGTDRQKCVGVLKAFFSFLEDQKIKVADKNLREGYWKRILNESDQIFLKIGKDVEVSRLSLMNDPENGITNETISHLFSKLLPVVKKRDEKIDTPKDIEQIKTAIKRLNHELSNINMRSQDHVLKVLTEFLKALQIDLPSNEQRIQTFVGNEDNFKEIVASFYLDAFAKSYPQLEQVHMIRTDETLRKKYIDAAKVFANLDDAKRFNRRIKDNEFLTNDVDDISNAITEAIKENNTRVVPRKEQEEGEPKLELRRKKKGKEKVQAVDQEEPILAERGLDEDEEIGALSEKAKKSQQVQLSGEEKYQKLREKLEDYGLSIIAEKFQESIHDDLVDYFSRNALSNDKDLDRYIWNDDQAQGGLINNLLNKHEIPRNAINYFLAALGLKDKLGVVKFNAMVEKVLAKDAGSKNPELVTEFIAAGKYAEWLKYADGEIKQMLVMEGRAFVNYFAKNKNREDFIKEVKEKLFTDSNFAFQLDIEGSAYDAVARAAAAVLELPAAKNISGRALWYALDIGTQKYLHEYNLTRNTNPAIEKIFTQAREKLIVYLQAPENSFVALVAKTKKALLEQYHYNPIDPHSRKNAINRALTAQGISLSADDVWAAFSLRKQRFINFCNRIHTAAVSAGPKSAKFIELTAVKSWLLVQEKELQRYFRADENGIGFWAKVSADLIENTVDVANEAKCLTAVKLAVDDPDLADNTAKGIWNDVLPKTLRQYVTLVQKFKASDNQVFQALGKVLASEPINDPVVIEGIQNKFATSKKALPSAQALVLGLLDLESPSKEDVKNYLSKTLGISAQVLSNVKVDVKELLGALNNKISTKEIFLETVLQKLPRQFKTLRDWVVKNKADIVKLMPDTKKIKPGVVVTAFKNAKNNTALVEALSYLVGNAAKELQSNGQVKNFPGMLDSEKVIKESHEVYQTDWLPSLVRDWIDSEDVRQIDFEKNVSGSGSARELAVKGEMLLYRLADSNIDVGDALTFKSLGAKQKAQAADVVIAGGMPLKSENPFGLFTAEVAATLTNEDKNAFRRQARWLLALKKLPLLSQVLQHRTDIGDVFNHDQGSELPEQFVRAVRDFDVANKNYKVFRELFTSHTLLEDEMTVAEMSDENIRDIIGEQRLRSAPALEKLLRPFLTQWHEAVTRLGAMSPADAEKLLKTLTEKMNMHIANGASDATLFGELQDSLIRTPLDMSDASLSKTTKEKVKNQLSFLEAFSRNMQALKDGFNKIKDAGVSSRDKQKARDTISTALNGLKECTHKELNPWYPLNSAEKLRRVDKTLTQYLETGYFTKHSGPEVLRMLPDFIHTTEKTQAELMRSLNETIEKHKFYVSLKQQIADAQKDMPSFDMDNVLMTLFKDSPKKTLEKLEKQYAEQINKLDESIAKHQEALEKAAYLLKGLKLRQKVALEERGKSHVVVQKNIYTAVIDINTDMNKWMQENKWGEPNIDEMNVESDYKTTKLPSDKMLVCGLKEKFLYTWTPEKMQVYQYKLAAQEVALPSLVDHFMKMKGSPLFLKGERWSRDLIVELLARNELRKESGGPHVEVLICNSAAQKYGMKFNVKGQYPVFGKQWFLQFSIERRMQELREKPDASVKPSHHLLDKHVEDLATSEREKASTQPVRPPTLGR